MSEFHLKFELQGERGIQSRYSVIVNGGDESETVDHVSEGNFDCTPYEPDHLYWSYVVELHRVAPKRLVLKVTETERVVTIKDGEWVERQTNQDRVFGRADDGWQKIREGDQLLNDDWGDALSSLSDETLIERAKQGG